MGAQYAELPIDVIPHTYPPQFRWVQVVDSLDGAREQESEGQLPPNIEDAVLTLVAMTKGLLKENALLRGNMVGMSDRIAAQSELLAKRAESPAQGASSKKTRG